MRNLSHVFSFLRKNIPEVKRLRIFKLCIDNVTLIG